MALLDMDDSPQNKLSLLKNHKNYISHTLDDDKEFIIVKMKEWEPLFTDYYGFDHWCVSPEDSGYIISL